MNDQTLIPTKPLTFARFPTPKAGRVEQRLSMLSLTYKNDNFIHDRILPVIGGLKNDSGLIGSYDSSHLSIYRTRKGVYNNEANMLMMALGDDQTYQMGRHDVTTQIPDVIREQFDDPFVPERDAVWRLEQVRDVAMEMAIASLMQSTSIMTQYAVPSTKWSDYTFSDPFTDLSTAQEGVRIGSGGKMPNRLVIGAKVMAKLQNHPKVVSRINGVKMTLSRGDVITQLAGHLSIPEQNILVGGAMYNSAAHGQAETLTDIWGDNVILYYAPESAQLATQSFGFRLKLSGEDKRVTMRRDTRNDDADLVKLEWIYCDVVTNVNCAYLLSDVLA